MSSCPRSATCVWSTRDSVTLRLTRYCPRAPRQHTPALQYTIQHPDITLQHSNIQYRTPTSHYSTPIYNTAHCSTPIYNTAPQHHTTALQYTIQHLDITLQHSNMENPQITPQHLNVQYSTLESQHSAPACCSTAMYSTGSAKVTLQYPILPQSSQVPLKVESNPINIA